MTAPRVLHVLPSLDAGGAERLVVELVTGARERGVDARIAVLAPARADSPVLADATERSLPVTVLGRHRFDPMVLARLQRLARGADVVHAHLFPAFYAVALVVGARKRIVTEHSPTNSRRGRRGLRLVERLVYLRYEVKVAISDGVARALSEYLDELHAPSDVVVVDNGVRLERFSPAAPEIGAGDTALDLVAVGTLDMRKDVARAVRAVAAVRDVRLTVVGDGPERARLEALAESLHAEVTFLGVRADIPELLREHDALVMTSRYEGFGLVAVEAMATGLPVLAPRLPGLSEVVGDAGLLHDPDAPAELLTDIERLRDDPALRARLGRAAQLQSKRFDLGRTIEAYEDLYSHLTGSR